MNNTATTGSETGLHLYALERAVFYDLEIYNNLFTNTLWDGKKKLIFEVSERKNQLYGMLQYLKQQPLLVGFNSSQYDNTILHYCLEHAPKLLKLTSKQLCQTLYTLSQAIIGYDKQEDQVKKTIGKLRFAQHFPFIDLLEVIREGYNIKGLKAVGINLKHERIQDLPYHWTAAIERHQIDEVLDYNFNDVLITEKIFHQVKERLLMRQGFSEKYHLNVYSDADSRIAKTTLDKFYAEFSGQELADFKYLRTKRKQVAIKDIIFPWVRFQTNELNDYLQVLRELVITGIDDQAKCDIPPLFFHGVEYTLALGGIHSVDGPGVFHATENTLLWDMDVASQYPNCILNNRVCPSHLNAEHFLGTLAFMVRERLDLKKLGKAGDKSAKIGEAGLKIAINTAYGLFNYKGYWLYDPKCTYAVTINNQLSLLMLVESLVLAGVEILSANTDGLVIRCRKDQQDTVKQVQAEWQQVTGFELEDTFYTKYVRRDINNFLCVKPNGEAKVKGIFIPQGGILKGYDKPIVAIALRNYFLDGIPLEQTITHVGTRYTFSNLSVTGEERVTDIYDYCMAQKVGSTFDRAECQLSDSTVSEVQRSLRYYASNQGVELFKVKTKEDGTVQRNTLLSSSPVTLFNDFVDGPYDINFQYYIDEARKIVYQIEGKTWLDKEKLQAKLLKLGERADKLQALWDKYDAKYTDQSAEKQPKIYHQTKQDLAAVQADMLHFLTQLHQC